MRTLALAMVLMPVVALAGEPAVVDVRATRGPGGTVNFDVTVRHADTGWEHYADAFTVHAPDGTLLGTRTLFHPHVNEQPFTRSLRGVAVPDGLTAVKVRADDSVHGQGAFVEVPLPLSSARQ